MVDNLIEGIVRPMEEHEASHLDERKGILEVQNLSAWYGNMLAVKNISMSIKSAGNHRHHRSLWLRQVHFHSLSQPDA